MKLFMPADILMPNSANLEKWAVIACDQFTSNAEYWKEVRDTVSDAPSTLHMILPEAELEDSNDATVAKIHESMRAYLTGGVFREYKDSYIYVERTLQDGSVRQGIVGIVDLEAYDYNPDSVSAVRATEQTVLERIPPRCIVRREAEVELPHVLMLCDDDQRQLIEPLSAQKDQMLCLYDFDLMQGGGHIRGYLLSKADTEAFDHRFEAYCANCADKQSASGCNDVVLVVGDGNHSLAAAKRCYEELKEKNPNVDFSEHPARFALVELENIHADALSFEPIHRIVTKVDVETLLDDLKSICAEDGSPVEYYAGDQQGVLRIACPNGELSLAMLQHALDSYLANHTGSIDYIHGDDEVKQLATAADAIGFLLPPMEKSDLFRGVIADGVLPRKTFSMGHAREKRYYLEGRRIK